MTYKKVLIIGWDGATFDLLEPWLNDQDLPNLHRLAQQGSRAVLQSVHPPSSAPAWASFLTGKNPGQHGVFGWYEPGRYSIDFINARALKSRTAAHILGDHGRRLGLINVPMTYPPRPLAGFVIPGMLTPDQENVPTYPPDLLQRLPAHCQPYVIDPPGFLSEQFASFETPQREDRYLEALVQSVRTRTCAAQFLMTSQLWDMLVVVYTASDRLQHYYWRHLHPAHPQHDATAARQITPKIKAIFQELDRAAGALIEAAGPDALVMLISDHGFGSCTHHLNLSRWLIEQGWLVAQSDPRRSLLRGLRRLLRRADFLNLRRRVTRLETRRKALRWAKAMPTDWQRTRAYLRSTAEQGIYINLAGREPQGCVQPGPEYEALCETIAQGLLRITDPQTGAPVVTDVVRGRDVYTGAYAHLGPDLLLQTRGGRYWNLKLAPDGPLISDDIPVSGYHRPEGIFLCAGQAIRRQSLAPASIVDVLPTALYALGLPIPPDLDGHALTGLFEPSYLATHPLQYAAEVAPYQAENAGLDEDEAAAIRERLEGLGYLG